jgi:hypothetical protein
VGKVHDPVEQRHVAISESSDKYSQIAKSEHRQHDFQVTLPSNFEHSFDIHNHLNYQSVCW